MKPRLARTDLRNGLLFAAPWILGFIGFTAYPIVKSIYYSFCSFDGISPAHWIGTQNYRILLTQDELFWRSLWNTLYMIVFGLPVGLLAALALAFLLNLKVKGMAFYRTIYYLPSITPVVAASALWLWLLNPEIGLVNELVRTFGSALHWIGLPAPKGPGWLIDPMWAKPALIFMGLWGAGGGMLIYLAGLQDVPEALYEAADLDGASSWQKLLNITLPMLSPVIFFNLIMGLIGTFQYFTQVYVMTGGGPQDATLFYALHLFNNAFLNFKMGYASAMAWILFVITLACTAVVFRTSARWVYYPGELK